MRKFFLVAYIFSSIIGIGCINDAVAVFRAVDGDSLENGEQRIRLYGIDAPEFFQTCIDKNNETYSCGQESLQYLENFLKNKNINCDCLAKKDKYKRSICECFADDVSINSEIVKQGWARAYRDNEKFKQEEQQAKKLKRGIWQGKHMHPAIYRVLSRYEKIE